MIENIGVTGTLATGHTPVRKCGGGEIHGPEHHPGGSEIDIAGVHDAEDFSTVQGEVVRVHGHAKPRDTGETAGASHGVEAGAGVEMMAAAGASADGVAVAVASVGKSVTAETDDQVRIHCNLRGVIGSG